MNVNLEKKLTANIIKCGIILINYGEMNMNRFGKQIINKKPIKIDWHKEEKIFASFEADDGTIVATGKTEEEVIKKTMKEFGGPEEDIDECIEEGDVSIVKLPKILKINIEEECKNETEGMFFILENKDVEVIRGDE